MSDTDNEFLMSEVEFDLDTTNPREMRLIIKTGFDMDGKSLYDILCHLVHDMIEPELFGEADRGVDVRHH